MERYKRRHLWIGWSTLLFFSVLGALLESLHGFKIPWYLSPSNEARRLMWTLSHAHGTLLALVHIAFAVTLHILPRWQPRMARASAALNGATVLLPGGFFLGGIRIYGDDPGIGIILVPVGALLLFVAVGVTGASIRRSAAEPRP